MPELTSLKSVKLDGAAGPAPKAAGGIQVKDVTDGDDSDDEGRDAGEFAPGGDADYFEEEVSRLVRVRLLTMSLREPGTGRGRALLVSRLSERGGRALDY